MCSIEQQQSNLYAVIFLSHRTFYIYFNIHINIYILIYIYIFGFVNDLS